MQVPGTPKREPRGIHFQFRPESGIGHLESAILQNISAGVADGDRPGERRGVPLRAGRRGGEEARAGGVGLGQTADGEPDRAGGVGRDQADPRNVCGIARPAGWAGEDLDLIGGARAAFRVPVTCVAPPASHLGQVSTGAGCLRLPPDVRAMPGSPLLKMGLPRMLLPVPPLHQNTLQGVECNDVAVAGTRLRKRRRSLRPELPPTKTP